LDIKEHQKIRKF